MMDHYYGPLARVVCKPAAAPSCDLVVQVRDDEDSGWVEIARYNDMSDDHAYIHAHNRAQLASANLEKGLKP